MLNVFVYYLKSGRVWPSLDLDGPIAVTQRIRMLFLLGPAIELPRPDLPAEEWDEWVNSLRRQGYRCEYTDEMPGGD